MKEREINKEKGLDNIFKKRKRSRKEQRDYITGEF